LNFLGFRWDEGSNPKMNPLRQSVQKTGISSSTPLTSRDDYSWTICRIRVC
jgi:hypothetical protein